MIDNGILTFTHDEYGDFVAGEPGSLRFFRKYIGGDEYINGFHRWILYLADSSPSDLRHLPKVRERIQQVRQYRASSSRPSTVAMSAYPTKVGVDERLSTPFLVLPNTSSERREYIPIGWLTPEVIANQKLRILPDATLADFALSHLSDAHGLDAGGDGADEERLHVLRRRRLQHLPDTARLRE